MNKSSHLGGSTGLAQPVVGSPRDASCPRTIATFVGKLQGLSPLRGRRLLDVGCGGGSITRALDHGFTEVHGIDVQEEWLGHFRRAVAGDHRYFVHAMSASEMTFPDAYFDTIISVETLEHIPDLPRAVAECSRVLKPGGECLITCPNRLFPFENHGIRWRGRDRYGRVPLITWLPPLHDRLALARVFTVRSLDRLFRPHGFERLAVDYAWPTFEHGGNPLQKYFRPLLGLMRSLENSPLRMFGTSVIVKFVKGAPHQPTRP